MSIPKQEQIADLEIFLKSFGIDHKTNITLVGQVVNLIAQYQTDHGTYTRLNRDYYVTDLIRAQTESRNKKYEDYEKKNV